MAGLRGRLIWPVVARFARLSLSGTAADPDGAGPLTTGYDPDFRAPVAVHAGGSQVGTPARAELADLDLDVQVEDQAWEALREMRTGDAERVEMSLVIHFRQLERLGLVDATTGDALAPRIGDRLKSLHRKGTLALIQAVPTPPGLYVVEAQPRSHGLSGGTRNLLVVTLRERATSSPKV
jgi:hypothetical protein